MFVQHNESIYYGHATNLWYTFKLINLKESQTMSQCIHNFLLFYFFS